MIETFNVENSFWEEHPDVKIIEPFKGLYNKDKSRGKKDSSTMMWFISLCYSLSSKFYKQPIEEKYPTIGEDFCGDINYYENNKKAIDDLLPEFIKWTFSEGQQHVHELKQLIHRRTMFIKTQEYDLDNYDKLDKMIANTKLVFDNLKKAEDQLQAEQSSGSVAGGAVESLND